MCVRRGVVDDKTSGVHFSTHSPFPLWLVPVPPFPLWPLPLPPSLAPQTGFEFPHNSPRRACLINTSITSHSPSLSLPLPQRGLFLPYVVPTEQF